MIKEEKEQANGLHILKAEIKNFKNIESRVIDFGGKSVIITGANGSGKSSLLQAIMSPLNAKVIPPKAIKNGEETGSVQIEIGGNLFGKPETYTLDLYFSQQHKSGRIKITDKNGDEVKGGRELVKTIIGNISFDVFQFINKSKTPDGKHSKAGVREQIDTLKSFLSDSERKQLNDLDNEVETIYSDRTFLNKEIDTLEAELRGSEYTAQEIEDYSTPIPIKPIQDKLSAIGEAMEKWSKVNNGVESRKEQLSKLNHYGLEEAQELLKILQTPSLYKVKSPLAEIFVTKLKLFVADLENQFKTAEENNATYEAIQAQIKQGEDWLKKNTKPTGENLTTELNDANKHNENHEKVKSYLKKHESLTKKKEESQRITKRLEEIKSEKAEVFAKSSLPVKGLSFDEEQVLYNGLPFTEEQHPTSTIIGVGVKIAMAMNPNLKVIVIKDGSLLDPKTMKAVLQMASKYNYQLLIEQVSDSKGEPIINFTETEI